MDIKRKLEIECEKKPDIEVCGFVVESDEGFDVIPCENRSTNPENEFYIPAKEFLYIKTKYKIVGIYHSHPHDTSDPSEFDEKTSDLVCYPFIIYCLKTNRFGIHVPEFSDAHPEALKKLKEELL